MKFAIPAGSLAKASFEMLQRSGYKISGQERTYRPAINDSKIELRILRPQEIPVFVSEGLQDVGITGLDWIRETDANVEILQDLEYGKIRMVTAISKRLDGVDSLSNLLEDFWSRGKNVRISTEYLNITADYIKRDPSYKKRFGNLEPLVVTPWWRRGKNPRVTIFLSFGATEAKPPEDADAIVDVTETGTTLTQNNLKMIDTVMESSAMLIANKKALLDSERREKIYDILTLLRGVVDGTKKLHIFVNVRRDVLPKLLAKLPALRRPTIAPLSDENWCSVNTVIEKDAFLELLPTIRKLAQGLVVYEPRQVLTLDNIGKGKERKSSAR
ncbi:MAG: ATP phosphoribosyltransferase [archaeon]